MLYLAKYRIRCDLVCCVISLQIVSTLLENQQASILLGRHKRGNPTEFSITLSILMIPERRIRNTTIPFEWSAHGRVYSVPELSIMLARPFAKSFVHKLPACELRKSGVPDSGYGVFLKRAARANQFVLDYGGDRISYKAADLLKAQVRSCNYQICNVLLTNLLICRAWIRI